MSVTASLIIGVAVDDGGVDVGAFNEVVYRAMKYAVVRVPPEIEFVEAQA
jgi:hypothetical protein